MNTLPCNGSSLGLLFRQVRDAMWLRLERELAAIGHDVNFSQFITLKTLAKGPAGVGELARAAQLHPARHESRGMVAEPPQPERAARRRGRDDQRPPPIGMFLRSAGIGGRGQFDAAAAIGVRPCRSR